MVSLPGLENYTESERRGFFKYSPVFDRYFKLLERTPESFKDRIRIEKHRYWLESAFAVLSQKFSAKQICQFWSERTDLLLKKTWEHCGLNDCKVSLLAFGKLGSKELNLSSDIDIAFVHREEKEKGSQFLEKVKSFIQILSENNNMGFCYRVDTSLRPGGDLSPLVPGSRQFFNYFDEFLEAWHRVSFIRLRFLIGPEDLNEDIRSYCRGVSFPRYLDFSVIGDIKNLRSRIQYKWKRSFQPLDIKLHPGGIRDIELYIQSLQVIYGGRHRELQNYSITTAMEELKKIKVIDEKEFDFFSRFYWDLRNIENLIQIDGDRHSYLLSHDFFGKSPFPVEEEKLIQSFKKSCDLINCFFSASPDEDSKMVFDFNSLGEQSRKAVDDILKIQTRTLKKRKIENKKKRILDHFLATVHHIAIDEDLAVQSFKDFILAIRSKSSIFYLLDQNHELLENLALLFSISPYIGQTLCNRPSLIDGFVLGHVEIHKGDNIEKLTEDYIDYKWLGHLFAITYFLKKSDLSYLVNHISAQAEIIAKGFLKHLKKQFGEDLEVLCMGKWSGFELGIYSDLDFIFLTEDKPTRTQIKMARRFIHLISATTNMGKLYNVDLRLKPDESNHHLLLPKRQLFGIFKNLNCSWQKQAYLRSRLLGDEDHYFKNKMNLLTLFPENMEELDNIQEKLFVKKTDGFIDVKYAPGGLVHCELMAQRLVLFHGSKPKNSSTVSLIDSLNLHQEDRHRWISHYQWLRMFEQVLQICSYSSGTKVFEKKNYLWKLGKILKVENPMKKLDFSLKRQFNFLKSLT